MKKYYIEIWSKYDFANYGKEYILQSKWFDKEQDALNWLNTIDYLDKNFTTSLMSAEFDKDGNIFSDIIYERDIV